MFGRKIIHSWEQKNERSEKESEKDNKRGEENSEGHRRIKVEGGCCTGFRYLISFLISADRG